jgi:ABC-2 type transport system permease protein
LNGLSLLSTQLRYENRAFWRNPAAAFFTFFFPLMFLFLFPVIFGSGEVERDGLTIGVVTFYVPVIAVFALITANYTNLAMTLTFAREAGVLKRKRGTPMSPALYMSGRIVHSTLIGLLLVLIILVVGVIFHDVDLPSDTAVAFMATIAIGSASFAALGIAITGFVPNEDAAPAIINATVLPLLFISDVFVPLQESTPEWLTTIAEIFPIYHFSQAMLASYLGLGDAWEWTHLAVIAIWGAVGVVVALYRFSWEPRR